MVTGDLARRHNLVRISDLAPGPPAVDRGPARCPERPLCLEGLQDVYRLRFARFKPMPTRDVTAAELDSGEIDVGMLDTTNPHLIDNDLVQLQDDRRLQPAENGPGHPPRSTSTARRWSGSATRSAPGSPPPS